MSILSATNEGAADRAIRVGLGLLLVSFAVMAPSAWWAWIGVIPLVTGIAGFCPLYRVLGLSSCAR
jgi:DUF2892 family protein